MSAPRPIQQVAAPAFGARRIAAGLAGVILVSLGAQAAVPIPGTPVPFTFQGPAVLIVGALLGPAAGSASLVLYLALGAAGLPVFAPTGAPGLARLLGPTGGYLLAYPVAAAIAGQVARDGRSWFRLGVGLLLGLLAIHVGGVAQLAALHGDMGIALRLGSLPFVIGDLSKLVVAGLVIRRFGPAVRALL